MQSASIPQNLIDVRPVVRNMRPDGYVLQTGGSATRKVIDMEGTQTRPMFRVSGVPRHTHNASALIQVQARGTFPITSAAHTVSYAEEFSEEKTEIRAGDFESQGALSEEEVESRFKRSIEWGIGRIELQPENSRNKISEPTRAISEIRTLVCPREIRESSTFIEKEYTLTDREGNPVLTNWPDVVMVPILPTNNGHIESQFAGGTYLDENLRLEIFPMVGTFSDIGIADGRDHNDWEDFQQSWTTLDDGGNNPAPLPYPVAVARIGPDNPVQRRPEIVGVVEWEDWDGRVPYRYDEDREVYRFDGPFKIRFQSIVSFSSNGLVLPNGADDTTLKKRNWFDPAKAADGTTEAAVFGGLVFSINSLPDAFRENGFFFVNGVANEGPNLSHVTENDVPFRTQYRYPRTLVQGTFELVEQKVSYNGGDVETVYTSQVRREVDNTAVDAKLLQDAVFATSFASTSCAWFAPMVRWEVGSKVAVSGPLIKPINYVIDLADASKHHVIFPDPATPALLAWSSAFQAIDRRSFAHSSRLTITDGTALSDLLDIRPNAWSLHFEGDDNLPLDEAETKASVNAGRHAVPFRAGLYPFPQDYRFRHFVGENLEIATAGNTTAIPLELDLAKSEAELCKDMYVPEDAPVGRTINSTGAVQFQWSLPADFATVPSTGNNLLKMIGVVGDSRASVFANLKPIAIRANYTDQGTERGRSKLITDQKYATGQVATVISWCSEFLLPGAPLANPNDLVPPPLGPKRHVICPCAYVARSTFLAIDDEKAAENTTITQIVAVNQKPFFDISFGRGVLAYRGGYCFNETRDYDDTDEPSTGNVFGFGDADFKKGGVEIVRQVPGNVKKVEMSVEVLGSGKTGTLRVKGRVPPPHPGTHPVVLLRGRRR